MQHFPWEVFANCCSYTISSLPREKVALNELFSSVEGEGGASRIWNFHFQTCLACNRFFFFKSQISILQPCIMHSQAQLNLDLGPSFGFRWLGLFGQREHEKYCFWPRIVKRTTKVTSQKVMTEHILKHVFDWPLTLHRAIDAHANASRVYSFLS